MGRSPAHLTTFEGVFVPTLTTILGVILFVRTGWIVGHLGLAGAAGVILASYVVSTATALSVASIATNVRIQAGGAFALLSRTLGIEPAGAIGLPLYLSQALAVTLYLFGFREGWVQVFPDHPAWAVDVGVFVVVFGAAAVSARFAFRLQFLVILVIAAAVLGIGGGVLTHELTAPEWWHRGDVDLYTAFGVFFPAVTGIMAGLNMSGELASPRRALRVGTLAAIGTSLVVYLGVAAVASWTVDPAMLRSDTTALRSAAAWSPIVVAGLLAATFSSALSTAVGAPRILQALADHGVVPFGHQLAQPGWRGQPHRALAVTAIVVSFGVAVRDLNTIAPLITLFFLLTYAAINAALLVQQGLELPRFRPTFRVPLAVPAVGLVGSLFGMVVVSPSFALVTVGAVAAMYAWLVRRAPEGPYGQVRAGTTLAAAAWAIGRLGDVPEQRSWQAHLLVPVMDAEHARGLAPLTHTLPRRGGSVAWLERGEVEGLEGPMEALRDRGITVRRGRVAPGPCADAVQQALDVLDAALFRPNLVVVPASEVDKDPRALGELSGRGRDALVGVWIAGAPPSQVEDAAVEESPWPRIAVWVEAQGILHDMTRPSLDMALLAVWRLKQAFGIDVDVVLLTPEGAAEDDVAQARRNLGRVLDDARIPGATLAVTRDGLVEALRRAEPALHLVVFHEPTEDTAELFEHGDEILGQLVVALRAGTTETAG